MTAQELVGSWVRIYEDDGSSAVALIRETTPVFLDGEHQGHPPRVFAFVQFSQSELAESSELIEEFGRFSDCYSAVTGELLHYHGDKYEVL